tara:strand:+ start:13579 stop:14691 length:1113 start_codon:yes stop_codon:yes gene_type:complete
MSKSYTPGLKILENTLIKKKRILPLSGKLHVKKDDLVKSDQIVASANIPGNVQMLNVSNKLNIDPNQILDCMLCKVDEEVKKGQIIAKTNGIFGFFKSELESPMDGVLINISDVTGQIIISEKPIPIEVDAYIDGRIVETYEKEGVLVSSKGVLVQGIMGIGGEKKGTLSVLDKTADLDGIDINNDVIAVINSHLDFETYKKMSDLGLKGIICGGIDYESLTKILGYPLGVAITGSENVTTVVVTEGFGDINMSDRTYNLFKKYENSYCSINGATQIRAGVMRPEVIISTIESELDSKDNNNDNESLIMVGSKVRIIREPFFGLTGSVSNLPKDLVKMKTETLVRVAEITLDDGTEKIIPRANLEVILSD